MITRVYEYGLLPPTVNAELVDTQIALGHRYFNELIAIERSRRAVVRAAIAEYPEVECHEAWRAAVEGAYDVAKAIAKQQRGQTRSRFATIEQREDVRDCRDQLQEVSRLLKEAKLALKSNSKLTETIARINADANAAIKKARASCGCYWGTKLLAEQASDAARATAIVDPSFRRWTGTGAIGAQLQTGLPVAEVYGNTSRLLRIGTELIPISRRGGKARPRVRLRVGSDERNPIWAEWPVIIHRPIPDDATIMWATVQRKRLGDKDHWSLHLTLRLPSPVRAARPDGAAVAVDIGWRRLQNGELRAGYWVNSDGSRGEIRVESTVLARLQKVDDLRSIRDKHLNVLRADLTARFKACTALPAWLVEVTQHMAQWKSQARFVGLALRWREMLDEGNEELRGTYQLLEEWRKKDKHLWLWECNLRDKVLRRRREQYRVLAARLAEQHDMLVIEQFDLRTTQRHKPVDSETLEIQAARAQQRLAATSILRSCLVQAFAARGRIVAEMPAQYTTRDCAACGGRTQWDQIKELEHRCVFCGTSWDQDVNACDNLLIRWREHRSDASNSSDARVVNHGAIPTESPSAHSKWGKRGRHNADRSKTDGQTSDNAV